MHKYMHYIYAHMHTDKKSTFARTHTHTHAQKHTPEEQSVHICDLNTVIVEKKELSDSAASKHLSSNTANTAEADDENTVIADVLFVCVCVVCHCAYVCVCVV